MQDIQHSTIFPIERAVKTVTRRLDTVLENLIGCNRREVWVLICVDDTQRSQRQIGDILDLHPNVLVKMLDRMEEQKLLRRVRRKSDRREHLVEATEKGKTRLRTYEDQRPQIMRQIFAPLTDDQIEQWKRLALLISAQ